MSEEKTTPQPIMPLQPTAPAMVVPIEYAGLWIAWNMAGTRIVASGRTVEEAVRAAEATGEEVIFCKVPKANVRYLGALCPSNFRIVSTQKEKCSARRKTQISTDCAH
jgi:Family of unknown function (DUF5678)